MSHKVTTQHFQIFVKACKFWCKQFGLLDHRINYYYDKLDDDSTCACTSTERESRCVAISLNTSWIVAVSKTRLENVALHEVMHVLLGDLTELANQRFTSEEDIDTANEAAVVRLENGISDLISSRKVKNNVKKDCVRSSGVVPTSAFAVPCRPDHMCS